MVLCRTMFFDNLICVVFVVLGNEFDLFSLSRIFLWIGVYLINRNDHRGTMRTKWIEDQQIIDFIQSHRDRYGLSPTMREICDGCGFRSTGSTTNRIKQLEEAGKLRQFKKGAARAYVPVYKSSYKVKELG